MPTLFELRHRATDESGAFILEPEHEPSARLVMGEDVIRDCRCRLAPKDFVEGKLNELRPYANAFATPTSLEAAIV